MKYAILIIISVIFFIRCTSPTKKDQIRVTKKLGLDEKFYLKGFNSGIDIVLNPNFTFVNSCYSFGCTGGFRVKVVTGVYDLKPNKINFIPKKMVWKEDWLNFYENSNLTFDTILYYESDTTSIQKQYWLLKDRQLKLLVSESNYNEHDELFYKTSNFISLANLYNSNVNCNLTKNLLSNKDTIVNLRNFSLKYIPKPYKNLFLENSIKAKIIGVKVHRVNESLIPRYRLEVEDKSKVRVGMKFYAERFAFNPIQVVKINEKQCIAEGEDLFFENTKLKTNTIITTERKSNYK
ncbi:hypothetical protein ACG2LH_11385 [Zhouia sp. PK063]|uniref:hypothetical protein n=1 Tax=Zhouia sp. PK063 TaxID=3373602 RepID=UPI0037AA7E68